jgi:hypothetical protein
LDVNREIAQRMSQLTIRIIRDNLAILNPVSGVLLNVARKVKRNKSSKPPIAEMKYKAAFNQRLDNMKIMTKTGILQKNNPHSSAYLIAPLAD